MVDAVTGANISLGDSVPIDSLAESIADTVTLGKVTGNLADVLNRAGSNEDEFNELLASTNSAAERTNIIMSALSTGGMVEASNSFRETSADIIEMNRSQLELNQAMDPYGASGTFFVNFIKKSLTICLWQDSWYHRIHGGHC